MKIDYLSVTVSPNDSEHVDSELAPILGLLGMVSAYNGVYKLHSGGALTHGRNRGGSYSYNASGLFLETLRSHSLYTNYLSAFVDVPHKVTRLDIAYDVHTHSPPVLKALKKRAYAGELKLSRKRLNPSTQVKFQESVTPGGEPTGTLYLGGARSSTVVAAIYDKKQEQFEKRRIDIPPTLRYELRLRQLKGMSLRDADTPSPLFWRYMSEVLTPPADVEPWEPSDAPPRLSDKVPILPAQSLKRMVDQNDLIDRMLDLADRIGPNGPDYLRRLIAERIRRHRPSQPGVGDRADSA